LRSTTPSAATSPGGWRRPAATAKTRHFRARLTAKARPGSVLSARSPPGHDPGRRSARRRAGTWPRTFRPGIHPAHRVANTADDTDITAAGPSRPAAPCPGCRAGSRRFRAAS
jgi:hypothetical protein